MEDKLINLTFTNWDKYNARKDIKAPRWFALSNRITEDDEIQTLDDQEFRAFVHLLCAASQKSGPDVSMNLSKAERVTGIKPRVFLSVVEKIEKFGICTRSVRDPYAIRTESVRETVEPVQNAYATRQDKTLQDTPPNGFKEAFDLYPLRVKGSDAEKRYRDQIKTEDQHQELLLALKNYQEMLSQNNWRNPKTTFAIFLGTKSAPFWRDFINWTPAPGSQPQSVSI